MRDNFWLKSLFDDLWKRHFFDVQRPNPIEVKFGGVCLRKMGSIILTKKKISRIRINGFFKNEFVPVEVIIAVLAHEIAHYSHGFCSLIPKKFDFPHRHKIVDKEIVDRGLKAELIFLKKWLKEVWPRYLSLAGKQKINNFRLRSSSRRKYRLPAPLDFFSRFFQ